ncbi:Lipoprotein signal peptidase [hydrothermal vent metagenome]|uniref:Lipoprotein signal peptidase n=1 Tax=hydrothermal vent metagenome TaxID=652676 RepID=A0A3B1DRD4_9ZZZZ
MPSVPVNRYFIFGIIALLGVSGDIYSKHLVFQDLGYPGGRQFPTAVGEYKVFDAVAPARNGETREYLNGWLSFRLYTSFNRGALWGIGQNMTWVFAALSFVAAAGVLYWLFKMGAAHSLWLTISLSLIFSGTLGNLWDRLGWHGCKESPQGEPLRAVRDFLLFTFGTYHWPIFNFADVFLVTGAIMLGVHSFFLSEENQQTKPATNS